MTGLTRRQAEVLEFFESYRNRTKQSPTYAEIGKAIGVSSSATVHMHVGGLVRKGYLVRVLRCGTGRELQPTNRPEVTE